MDGMDVVDFIASVADADSSDRMANVPVEAGGDRSRSNGRASFDRPVRQPEQDRAAAQFARHDDSRRHSRHAQMCIDAGADGITVHPRPDQRHIRADDCRALAPQCCRVEFNIEGNPFAVLRARSERPGVSDYPGFMALIRELRPHSARSCPTRRATYLGPRLRSRASRLMRTRADTSAELRIARCTQQPLHGSRTRNRCASPPTWAPIALSFIRKPSRRLWPAAMT
jgi:hypothetical protein